MLFICLSIVLSLGTLDGPASLQAAALDLLPRSTSPLLGRAGFDLAAPFYEISATAKGERRVRIAPSDRMELMFGGAVEAGYLLANGEVRPLPIGSHLDPAAGTFTWVPPVGYFGTYDLTFVQNGTRADVTVSVRPDDPFNTVALQVDDVAMTLGRALTVSGWALDADAFSGSGVSAVHVWAVRRNDDDRAPLFLGAAALDLDRADGPATDTGARAGFSLDIAPLRSGEYNVYVFAWHDRARAWTNARVISISVR